MIKEQTFPIAKFVAFLLCVTVLGTTNALAAPWNLPQVITDKNSFIEYRYSSNGSQTKGIIKGVQGRAWVEAGDYRRINVELTIPLPKISNSFSDLPDALKLVLENVDPPPVQVTLNKTSGLCSPQELQQLRVCDATVNGQSQFGGSNHSISFPIKVSRTTNSYRIEGQGSFNPSQADQLSMIDDAQVKFIVDLPDSSSGTKAAH